VTDPMNHGIRVVHEFIGGATNLGDALTELSNLAVTSSGADMAGLTVNDERGTPATVVYTDSMVPEIDQAQYEADRGPCLSAFREGHTVLIADVTTETRFPEFTDVARQHGIRTTFSVPLVVGGRGIGALNFYATVPETFDDEAVEVCTYVGRQAAIIAAYFDKAEQAQHLQQAMVSRAVIEQAKGVIMASVGCTSEEAFDLLRQQSQTENRKLRDIAEEIVAVQARRQS